MTDPAQDQTPDEVIINGVPLSLMQTYALQTAIAFLLRYLGEAATELTPGGLVVDETYQALSDVLPMFKFDIPTDDDIKDS